MQGRFINGIYFRSLNSFIKYLKTKNIRLYYKDFICDFSCTHSNTKLYFDTLEQNIIEERNELWAEFTNENFEKGHQCFKENRGFCKSCKEKLIREYKSIFQLK
jgi:hypothetical protein